MAYNKYTYRYPHSNEYVFTYAGRYGAKGEKRAKRKKPTPEQVKRQNQQNRVRKVQRLIKANFSPGDLWCTLKYPRGTRKPLNEVMEDFRKFHRRMRYQCKKRGGEFKFLYRVEIGKRGGIHFHILIKRIRGDPSMDVLIQEAWEPGRVNFESIHDADGYRDLAAYLVKEPDEEMEGQLSLFSGKEQKKLRSYSCSRNLIHPKPTKKTYSHWTMKRLLEEGPKPTEGYYVDKNSIEYGVNPFTGKSYYRYEEYEIKTTKTEKPQNVKAGEEGGG